MPDSIKTYSCVMEFFRWGKKSNPLSWIRITSPTGNSVLINMKYNRKNELDPSSISFLESLSSGKEWPEKNKKQYPFQTLNKFLTISKVK